MQQLNQTPNGYPMPLLMNFTVPNRIMEADDSFGREIYDPMSQTIEFNMRTIGTYSLRHIRTKKGTGSTSDAKNAIDDSKPVK
ncbi:MAG: hypothetical protein LBO69_01435 [Ignavibacteria bacterium]|jgi:hypothetical protein|nr:hypothetical protein [Ignavibacteria bacterium]